MSPIICPIIQLFEVIRRRQSCVKYLPRWQKMEMNHHLTIAFVLDRIATVIWHFSSISFTQYSIDVRYQVSIFECSYSWWRRWLFTLSMVRQFIFNRSKHYYLMFSFSALCLVLLTHRFCCATHKISLGKLFKLLCKKNFREVFEWFMLWRFDIWIF